jgi:trans-aconitate methyltransferase
MKISKILAKYGKDTDKIWHHRYGKAYDDLFSRFDRKAPLNIMEVGTQKGATLLAWKEYFPNANVYGVDIVDVVPKKYRKDTVTRVISDIKKLDTDIKFDIIIDDGSHYLADMVYVVANYFVPMRDKGVLILEDVRFPKLTLEVINNLIVDSDIGFPGNKTKANFNIRYYDCRRKGAESSFLIAMIKEAK